MARMLLACAVGLSLAAAGLCDPNSLLKGVSVMGPPHSWKVESWDGTMREWGSDEYARVQFNDTLSVTGWGFLAAYTNPNKTGSFDGDVLMAAGYGEGYLTSERIWQHLQNTGAGAGAWGRMNERQKQIVTDHKKWVAESYEVSKDLPAGNVDRAYWHHISLSQNHWEGIFNGYQATAKPSQKDYELFDIQLLTIGTSIGQVLSLARDPHQEDEFGARLHMMRERTHKNEMPEGQTRAFDGVGQRCSAFLRLAENNDDFFMSQVTWTDFNSMNRIWKMYDFPLSLDGDASSGSVPGARSSFSGYPGSTFSGDDFYLLGSGLVVQETTIGCADNSRFEKYLSPLTNWEEERNIVANRLATGGRTWGDLFTRFNSGTYNNQFMVFDYSKFVKGKPLLPGAFYLVEQIPGYYRYDDMTELLQTQRYYMSYNVPYFKDVYMTGGFEVNAKLYGPWFTYEETARAKIFRQHSGWIESIDDMQHLMRYNNYTKDPLSLQKTTCDYRGFTNCTPPYTTENTIAVRGDLNPKDGVWGIPEFGHRNHCGTDAKITSASTYDRTLPVRMISSPTYDQQPVFVWSTSPYNNTNHIGMPDRYEFPWMWKSFP